MPTKSKTIDVLEVSLNFLDDDLQITFEDILQKHGINNGLQIIQGRIFELQVIKADPDEDYLIGAIITTKTDGIPPKRNVSEKTYGPIELTESEGIAVSNIFLYSKRFNVLFFESTKGGCSLSTFEKYIYRSTKRIENFPSFGLRFHALLKPEEYQRMLRLDFVKSIELSIAQPTELIRQTEHQEDSLRELIEKSSENHVDKIHLKLDVDARRKKDPTKSGITHGYAKKIIDYCRSFMRIGNVRKLEIRGYEDTDQHIMAIDLIADRYRREIFINEPRIQSDTQVTEKSEAIKELYLENVRELERIFGS